MHDMLCSAWIPNRSNVERDQYFFVYRIVITNTGNEVMQLRNRSWHICNAREEVETVRCALVAGRGCQRTPLAMPSHTNL